MRTRFANGSDRGGRELLKCRVDDLDGELIDGTAEHVEFSYRGIAYLIDRRKPNTEKLKSILAPFISAADAARNQKGPHRVRRAQTAPPVVHEPFAGCDIDLWRNRFEELADPNRLRILNCLSTGPMCVTALARATGMSTSAVSHAVRRLRDRKIVSRQRTGRYRYYRLVDATVCDLLRIQHENTETPPP